MLTRALTPSHSLTNVYEHMRADTCPSILTRTCVQCWPIALSHAFVSDLGLSAGLHSFDPDSLYCTQPSPRGGDQAVMPTQRGRRRPPSPQGGGGPDTLTWSLLSNATDSTWPTYFRSSKRWDGFALAGGKLYVFGGSDCARCSDAVDARQQVYASVCFLLACIMLVRSVSKF
jgi:hypothetical protein